MLVLAIDTCDSRGSLAVMESGEVLNAVEHPAGQEYSTWLLAAVDRMLGQASRSLRDVDLFAVAAGPGSFTGVRIGLTTVKAWSEVFGKPVAAMSRLRVLAAEYRGAARCVASFIDAQRGQIFGGLYRSGADGLVLMGEERVMPTDEFVGWVAGKTGEDRVAWVSTEPAVMEAREEWQGRRARGEEIVEVGTVLAPLIGKLGIEQALRGEVVDALSLDAKYVRRSYVEGFGDRVAPREGAK
jgi:tRNA threonylcarbamoyladenosine biosynthesis protein TsaB